MISAAEIVKDPRWYLHSINLDQAVLGFVKTTPNALSDCSFLDHRFDISQLPYASIAINDLLGLSEQIESAKPVYVFHTAFCCSTLIARCLDLPSANVSLKEPAVLMELANAYRIGHVLLTNPMQSKAIFNLVSKLLFRPFGHDQTVLVKPTNTVNNIIRPLMSAHPASKALLLHSDLESFLVSILKKGEQGRGFLRQLFTILLMDSPEARQLDSNQLLRMTDSQIAAITWHLQLEFFVDAFKQFNSSRLRSLHCDVLLDQPNDTLAKLVDFFGYKHLSDDFDRLMDQAPLKHNAKEPGQQFDSQSRSQDYDRARSQYSDTLEVIIPWAKQLRFKYAYSDNIANPLSAN